MGKGMVTFFFWLTFLPTLRGHPLWRQAFLYGVMAHIWLTWHKHSPISEFQISALPCRGFLPLLELRQHGPAGKHIRMSLTFRIMFGPSLLKAWACQMSTHGCTWRNSIYHPWLQWCCPVKPLCLLFSFSVCWDALFYQLWGHQTELGLNGQPGKMMARRNSAQSRRKKGSCGQGGGIYMCSAPLRAVRRGGSCGERKCDKVCVGCCSLGKWENETKS